MDAEMSKVALVHEFIVGDDQVIFNFNDISKSNQIVVGKHPDIRINQYKLLKTYTILIPLASIIDGPYLKCNIKGKECDFLAHEVLRYAENDTDGFTILKTTSHK